MLPGLTLPGSLVALLGALRRCFTAPSFRTFCGLAAGLAGQPRRRAVVGMLLGAGLSRAWPHDRAHYFFARARWEIDELGLAVARLAVLLVPVGAPLTVAVDDSLFRRAGRKVYGAGWQYDGSSPAQDKLSFGTCFVVAGIVVHLRRRGSVRLPRWPPFRLSRRCATVRPNATGRSSCSSGTWRFRCPRRPHGR